jgi:hypothetical protein
MQIGDKVRLTSIMPKWWVKEMNIYLGKVVTITHVDGLLFYTKECKWTFHKEDIAEYITDSFESQVKRVLNHLQDKTITSWEAINKYGITRLSAIIFVLRKDYTITSTRRSEGKKWWTEYKLIK